MTPLELRVYREGLGLTQDELAAWLAVDPRTVRRWEKGVSSVPEAAAAQLRDRAADTANVIAALEAAIDRDNTPVLTFPVETTVPNTAAWYRRVAFHLAVKHPALWIREEDDDGLDIATFQVPLHNPSTLPSDLALVDDVVFDIAIEVSDAHGLDLRGDAAADFVRRAIEHRDRTGNPDFRDVCEILALAWDDESDEWHD